MNILNTPRFFWVIVLVAATLWPANARTAEAPSPTPTPRPRVLGDFKLKTGARADGAGQLVISNSNLADYADRGTVTLGELPTSAPRRRTENSSSGAADRERWRSRVMAQRRKIDDLDRKRMQIEAQIELIESGRLTVRALARIQQAEIELDAVARDIANQKKELGRLIREARRRGAEPGWFR